MELPDLEGDDIRGRKKFVCLILAQKKGLKIMVSCFDENEISIPSTH